VRAWILVCNGLRASLPRTQQGKPGMQVKKRRVKNLAGHAKRK